MERANKNKNRKKIKNKSKLVPGLTGQLEENASPEDIRKGNYTRVTRVFLDENDPV